MFEIGEAPPSIMVNQHEVAKRSMGLEGPSVPSKTGWPITCYASGVNARDADKLRDYLKEKGVPTEVTRDGDPVYTDAAHRRKALKARGLVDRAGYS
jgi:hypothetical protein